MRSVVFNPDGTLIATGGRDNRIRLWYSYTGTPVPRFYGKGHSDLVSSLAFSPDGRWIASGSHDDSVRLWRVQDGENVKLFPKTRLNGSVEKLGYKIGD